MSKLVTIDGDSIRVPDDATPDQIQQLHNERVINRNPSDSIPKAKASIPSELQGPPPSTFRRVMQNIPGSIMNTAANMPRGMLAPAGSDTGHPATYEDFRDQTLPSIKRFMEHPIDNLKEMAIEHPVESALTVASAGRGSMQGPGAAILKSGVKGALKEGFEPITYGMHRLPVPAAVGGMMAGHFAGSPFGLGEAGSIMGGATPFIRGAVRGAREGLSNYRVVTPNIGGPVKPPPVPNNVSNVTDMPVGPTIKPVLPSGRTVPSAAPETLPNKPVTRAGTLAPTPEAGPEIASHPVESESPKIIYDEKGQPLTTEDPINGVGEKDFDIHKKIAQEGVDKRATDSRAKYEDVYQNIIKNNYSPEELRSLATNPEAKTYLDLKIKDLKHPEGHPKAGHRKYGSGLNPMMIDSLAQRLEAETPQ